MPEPLPPDRPAYLTALEVAGLLRISRQSVYNLVESKQLPGIHLGRCVRIPADALDAYLKRQAGQGGGR